MTGMSLHPAFSVETRSQVLFAWAALVLQFSRFQPPV
jgi:hypothetical protein